MTAELEWINVTSELLLVWGSLNSSTTLQNGTLQTDARISWEWEVSGTVSVSVCVILGVYVVVDVGVVGGVGVVLLWIWVLLREWLFVLLWFGRPGCSQWSNKSMHNNWRTQLWLCCLLILVHRCFDEAPVITNADRLYKSDAFGGNATYRCLTGHEFPDASTELISYCTMLNTTYLGWSTPAFSECQSKYMVQCQSVCLHSCV